jgi:mRNA interferase HigB
MEIAGVRAIEKFQRMHPAARGPLEDWVAKVAAAMWNKPLDIKRMFSTVSFVRQFVIFNIGGNRYRLLTQVFYESECIEVLRVGTHEEYDRWKL